MLLSCTHAVQDICTTSHVLLPALYALGAAFLLCVFKMVMLCHMHLAAAKEAKVLMCSPCASVLEYARCRNLAAALIAGHCCCCRIDRSDYPAQAGGYAGWTTPYSYNTVRTLQQDIGLLKNGSCLRSNEIEDLITCAAGQIKLSLDQLRMQCAREGLHCPDVSNPPKCTACSACA